LKQRNFLPFLFFWIILALFCITYYQKALFMYPSLIHAWAQSDRLALAIAFYDNGMNFFKPATLSLFQAAWHEDQVVGVLAAQYLDLPILKQAIELLYLCLSGDLCELRWVLTEPLCRFFEQVYVQPALSRFLRRLPELDGRTLNMLSEERAQRLYRTLMSDFRRFLDVKVPWGMQLSLVPLYKLLFANVARLHLIADDLRDEPAVRDAGAVLEAAALRIIDAMLSPS
jgi:hypothetical protein